MRPFISCIRRQVAHQAQVANLSPAAQEAKEANWVDINMGRKVVDAVAAAIEEGGERLIVIRFIYPSGPLIVITCIILPAVPDGQPAAGIRVEVAGVPVPAVQDDGAVSCPAPAAAVPVPVKVEVIHQLVAKTTRVRAASCDCRAPGAEFVAGAGQVVPHIAQFLQAGDLDETIAIGVCQAGEDGQGHPGGNDAITQGIAGGDPESDLATKGLRGAGDLAAVIAVCAGDGEPSGQVWVDGATSQMTTAVVDQH